jgi:biotin operon repressor
MSDQLTARLRWRDAIWEAPDLRPLQRLVALAYEKYAGNGVNDVWVSGEELRRVTGVSRSTANDALRALEAAGWLVVVRKATQHYSTRYRLVVPRTQHSDSQNAASPSSVARQSVQHAASRHQHAASRTPTATVTTTEQNEAASRPRAGAQSIITAWVDLCHQRPPARVLGQVAREVSSMLDEGFSEETVTAGVLAWHQRSLHPSALPSIVNELLNPPTARGPVAAMSTTDQRVLAGMNLTEKLRAEEHDAALQTAIGAGGVWS